MGLKPTSLARSDSHCQTPAWKRELAEAFTRPDELLEALQLPRRLLPGARRAGASFRLLVPRNYAALIEPGVSEDPLLRQVLPLGEELMPREGFRTDPVGDRAAVKTAGLLQKYRGRALLMTTGACAVHCRYCFRRHFPYGEASALHDGGTAALEWLAGSPDINEVILSGGDPLMLDDDAFQTLTRRLEAIPHLERLRVHTRIPVVLPSRVTAALCRSLTDCRLTPVVVVHANHPRELSAQAGEALARLRAAGVTLLNQSVLLRGVNDAPETLAGLSEALFANGVLPYYLHLLDRVQGASHFDVSTAAASSLMTALRVRLPGYLVPRLVREEAGGAYKAPFLAENRLWFNAGEEPIIDTATQ